MSAKVVLLANDLMLGSTVSGAVSMSGMEYCCVGSEADAIEQAASNDFALLLIDLGTQQLNVASLAAGLPAGVRQNAIAYGPHVHTEKLDAAKAAGIGHVISRGQFSAQISQIIQQFAAAAKATSDKNQQ